MTIIPVQVWLNGGIQVSPHHIAHGSPPKRPAESVVMVVRVGLHNGVLDPNQPARLCQGERLSSSVQSFDDYTAGIPLIHDLLVNNGKFTRSGLLQGSNHSFGNFESGYCFPVIAIVAAATGLASQE